MPQTISKTSKDIAKEAVATVPAISAELVNMPGGVGAWQKAGGKLV